jgi:hypothetical protein
LPTNDSVLFSVRFSAVQPKDAGDCRLRQFFEVSLSRFSRCAPVRHVQTSGSTGAYRWQKKKVMKNANHVFFGLLLAFFPSGPGLAQTTVDIAKITCEQLVLLKVADPDHIAIWLSGYYNGKRNTTTSTSSN